MKPDVQALLQAVREALRAGTARLVDAETEVPPAEESYLGWHSPRRGRVMLLPQRAARLVEPRHSTRAWSLALVTSGLMTETHADRMAYSFRDCQNGKHWTWCLPAQFVFGDAEWLPSVGAPEDAAPQEVRTFPAELPSRLQGLGGRVMRVCRRLAVGSAVRAELLDVAVELFAAVDELEGADALPE